MKAIRAVSGNLATTWLTLPSTYDDTTNCPTLSGCPSSLVAIANISSFDKCNCPNSLAKAIPATITDDDDPRPLAKGTSDTIFTRCGLNSEHTLKAVAIKRLFSSLGTPSKSCKTSHFSEGSKTSIVKYLDTAIPTESKPGPKLAEVAGTVIFI